MKIRITIKDTTPFKASEPIVLEAECPIKGLGTKLRQMVMEHSHWQVTAEDSDTKQCLFKAWRSSKGNLHIDMPKYGQAGGLDD